jgi:hypothetical protein
LCVVEEKWAWVLESERAAYLNNSWTHPNTLSAPGLSIWHRQNRPFFPRTKREGQRLELMEGAPPPVQWWCSVGGVALKNPGYQMSKDTIFPTTGASSVATKSRSPGEHIILLHPVTFHSKFSGTRKYRNLKSRPTY